MKKIALFSLVCCLCGVYAVPAFAGTCGAKSININGLWGKTNQNPKDNEFLYTDPLDQTKAEKDFKGPGTYKLNSYALECDDDYCGGFSVVYLPDDGIVGNTRGKYFICRISSVNDWWEPIRNCSDGEELRNLEYNFYIARKSGVENGKSLADYKIYRTLGSDPCVCNGEVYNHDGQQYCRVNGSKTPTPTPRPQPQPQPQPVTGGCLEIDGMTKVAKGKTSVHQVCQVKALSDAGAEQCVCQCVDNNKWRCDVTSCKGDSAGRNYNWIEKETNISGGKGVCKEVKKGTPVTKSCKESRKTPTGKACCDVPKAQAEYNGKTDTCICLDANAEFRIENGKGRCVDKNPQQPGVEEPAKECTYYFSGTIECGNGKNVTIKEERAVTVPCIEGVVETLTEEMFKNDTGKLRQIKDELCNGETAEGVATSGEITSGGTIAVNQQQEYKIRDAEKILDAFTERAESERSVWKTSEGKFNTTRLASDITAGVVLGTVGGVVTGVVIKKNQVKKGFEALHCTVGGQKVAEWGDEFSVGLQR